MSTLQTLNTAKTKIITDHYLREVLQDAAEDIFEDQSRVITNSTGSYEDLLSARTYSISSGTLTLSHSIRERFVDMNRIRGVKQASIQVHNKIIWTQFNVIIRRLKFGFVEDIKNAIVAKYRIEI